MLSNNEYEIWTKNKRQTNDENNFADLRFICIGN